MVKLNQELEDAKNNAEAALAEQKAELQRVRDELSKLRQETKIMEAREKAASARADAAAAEKAQVESAKREELAKLHQELRAAQRAASKAAAAPDAGPPGSAAAISSGPIAASSSSPSSPAAESRLSSGATSTSPSSKASHRRGSIHARKHGVDEVDVEERLGGGTAVQMARRGSLSMAPAPTVLGAAGDNTKWLEIQRLSQTEAAEPRKGRRGSTFMRSVATGRTARGLLHSLLLMDGNGVHGDPASILEVMDEKLLDTVMVEIATHLDPFIDGEVAEPEQARWHMRPLLTKLRDSHKARTGSHDLPLAPETVLALYIRHAVSKCNALHCFDEVIFGEGRPPMEVEDIEAHCEALGAAMASAITADFGTEHTSLLGTPMDAGFIDELATAHANQMLRQYDKSAIELAEATRLGEISKREEMIRIWGFEIA